MSCWVDDEESCGPFTKQRKRRSIIWTGQKRWCDVGVVGYEQTTSNKDRLLVLCTGSYLLGLSLRRLVAPPFSFIWTSRPMLPHCEGMMQRQARVPAVAAAHDTQVDEHKQSSSNKERQSGKFVGSLARPANTILSLKTNLRCQVSDLRGRS